MFLIKKWNYYFIICLFLSLPLQGQIKTPLVKSNFTNLTSHLEMMKYLEFLVESSENISMKIIGKSVNGLEIPALFLTKDENFGQNRKNKPIVLIYAQQHGNEPAGKEAVLIAGYNLLNDDSNLLDNIDLILVPQVNPDGSEAGVRRNANKMDLNRNHVILSEPESEALHKLFLQWMPEVTLDMHETNILKKDWISNGILKDAEEMFGAVTNLNISDSIRNYSKEKFLPGVGKKIINDGFRYHEYIVGSPFNGKRIRYSTTNVNDGRQSMGIYNTMSFVVECIRFGDLITKAERRVTGHVSAIKSFLKTVDENHKYILDLVNTERNKLVTGIGDKRIAIQMDYYKDPTTTKLAFPVFNLSTWHHEIKELNHYEPLVKIIRTVKRPFAYLFSSKEKRLIELLKKHQIEMQTLVSDVEINVEAYTILNQTSSVEEDKKSLLLDLESKNVTKEFSKGDVVIVLNQKASILIPLLLEPESNIGILSERSAHQYKFIDYIQDGKEYPIYRILDKGALTSTVLK